MAFSFGGTDTNKTYTAGQQYVSAGRVYTAQADGSFSRANADGSTGYSAGSSASYGETRTSDGGGGNPAMRAAGGPVSSSSSSSSGGGSPSRGFAGVGPGQPGVIGKPGAVAGPGVAQTQRVNAFGNLSQGGAWGAGGILGAGFGAPTKVTDVYIDNFRLPRNRGTSDAGDIEQARGESEFLSPTWFYNWAAEVSHWQEPVRSWEVARYGAVTNWQDGGGLEGAIYSGVAEVRQSPVPYARQPAFIGSDEFGFANPRN